MSFRDESFAMDLYIRAQHPAGYRSGQWAKVLETRFTPAVYGKDARPGRPVFVVEFIDGQKDLWPVYDSVAEYEFAHSVSA